MRLSTMILLVFIMQASARNSYSQRITYSCSNTPLEQVFKVIKQQTGYVVFYDQDIMSRTRPVTISAKDLPLESFLKDALDDQALDYSIENKTIIISRRETPTPVPYAIPVRNVAITGVIVDQRGVPVMRAIVRLMPTPDIGTNTNDDGTFTLSNVPPGSYTLEVRHLSFLTAHKKITVKDADMQVKIAMTPQQVELRGVVISTGYQKMEKANSPAAVETFSERDIQASPDINITRRLEGLKPGIRFDPRTNNIQIRSVNNFRNSAPLIVIDGFPALEQNLNLRPGYTPTYGDQVGTNSSVLSAFNPTDIESITILKDAAATAIWGSSAANGVIVIETKKGRRGETPVVSAGAAMSISAPANMKNLNAMNSRQYVDLEREMFDANFYQDPFTHWRYQNPSQAIATMFRARRGEISEQERDAVLEGLANTNNQSQIRNELLRPAVTQQYNLSVSGGGKNSSYFVSGNYSKDQPVYKSNGTTNYFMNSSLTTDMLGGRVRMTAGLNHNYSNSVVNSAALNAMVPGTFGLRPYDQLLDEQGNPKQYSILFKPEIEDSLRNKLGMLPWTYSAIDQLNYSNTRFLKQATRMQLNLSSRITSWAELQVAGMYQRSSQEMTQLDELESYITRDKLNTATSIQNGKPVYGIPVGGMLRRTNSFATDYSGRVQLNINKTWNTIHRLTLLAGSDIRESKSKGYRQTQYGFDENLGTAQPFNPSVLYRNFYGGNTSIGFEDGALTADIRRYLSYFSNANYSLMGKYHVSGSVRFDDFSVFGLDRRNRAVPLWSTGLKWDMNQERFMSGIKWLDALSLRATYGTAGTAPMSGSNFTVVNTYPAPVNTGLPYATIGSPGNQDLGWETTATLNGGLDAQILHGLLALNFDIYSKRSYGIIASLPFNTTYGWDNLWYNTATMRSHGFEFGINANVIRRANWSYNTTLNFSYNYNKVTDARFAPTVSSITGNTAIEGHPVDYLMALNFAGLDDRGQTLIRTAEGKTISSTDASALKPEDYTYQGRRQPPMFGGFLHTVRYKQLSLSARITYYLGHKIMKQDVTTNGYPLNGVAPGFAGSTRALANRWRNPGDEAFTTIPGVINANFTSISRYRDADINAISASHARFDQLTMSYILPAAVMKKLSFAKSVTMGATASNLGVIWRKNKDGIDPMYVLTQDFGSLAPSPTYTFNLNVSF
ncbi:SusC/RagA family TonB-linked outer membrane protein [Chitinophaga rhizophila]|uniref:SusC/RagA family TonB-linked outer membrane protein n=1 Tax=Chitinophaga rhizophila TaxID=2866212 RepID=A0ABS7GHC6_9BACT|nr:SusC/RagA family TonB-linked outer membrane protein [Chitinophaga rhizophila]MBW8687099.1 SusC/RagA family TonB-linked outer membrane protein [Chitinophaga rhizophila]